MDSFLFLPCIGGGGVGMELRTYLPGQRQEGGEGKGCWNRVPTYLVGGAKVGRIPKHLT